MSEEEREQFDQIAQDFFNNNNNNQENDGTATPSDIMNDNTYFPSAFPTNSFPKSVKKKNEGGQSPLYSDDEWMGVLSLHEELSQMGCASDGDDGGDIDGDQLTKGWNKR